MSIIMFYRLTNAVISINASQDTNSSYIRFSLAKGTFLQLDVRIRFLNIFVWILIRFEFISLLIVYTKIDSVRIYLLLRYKFRLNMDTLHKCLYKQYLFNELYVSIHCFSVLFAFQSYCFIDWFALLLSLNHCHDLN